MLVLAVASRGWITFKIPADFRIGSANLLVIAIGLVALAITERSRAFLIYVVGFLGLALLSCLYDVSNLFVRLGIGSTWNGNTEALPNLIVPGLYLLIGGVVFEVPLKGWMVGDSPHADIEGGRAAGLATIWMARGRDWDESTFAPPDAEVATIVEAVSRILDHQDE